MASPWEPDTDLTADAASAIVSAAAPELGRLRLSFLNEGWDCRAFEADGWVFRFSKRAAENHWLAREVSLLTFLSGRLPLPVPEPRFHGPGWMGYRKLRGRPATLSAPDPYIASRLAHFLTALHATPPCEIERLSGEPPFASPRPRDLGRMRDRAREALTEAQSRADVLDGDLLRWVNRFLDTPPPPEWSGANPVLVHNDLLVEHVLIEDASISGIIDWTDAALGDPAADFAGLAHWGGAPLLRHALHDYKLPVDPGFAERATYIAACVGLLDIGYGSATQRAEYVQRGETAIKLAAGQAG